MKKTLTIMALLAALGAVPQGVAQQEMTLTSGNQQHISVTESTDIYVDGNVVFDGLENSGRPGGAAISMGPDGNSLVGGGPLDVSLIGLSEDRTDNLTFSHNVHHNVDNEDFGGAVGCSSVSLYIRVYFEHLNRLVFEDNRLVNKEAHPQACGGGSAAAMYVVFGDIGYLELKGTYKGGDVAEADLDKSEDVNASFGGAVRAGALWFDGVDEVHMNQILTAGDYLGGSSFDIGSGTSYIYNCGYVDFSNNTTLYDLRSYSFPAGSVMDIDAGKLFCAENYRLDENGDVCGGLNISDNYACNAKILHFKASNYTTNGGIYAFFLNGDFTFVDNRAGVGHAGMEMYLIPLDSPGLLLLSADMGDITFKGNVGGVNQEQYAEEMASGKTPACGVGQANRMENVASSVVFSGNFKAEHPASGDFRAVEGHTIHFYDPVRMEVHVQGESGYMSSDGEVLKIRYNTPLNYEDSRVTDTFIGETYQLYYPNLELTYGGTIQFSGEYYQETNHTADSYLQKWASESDYEFAERLLRSRWSTLLAQSTVLGGEFLVENGAVYGDGEYEYKGDSGELVHEKYLNYKLSAEEDGYKLGQNGENLTVALEPDGERWVFEKDTSLDIQKGALAIRTDGIVIAKNISFSGHDAMLRMDDTARIIADRVDLTKGVSVDFNHALEHGVKIAMLSDAGTKSHQLVHAKLTVTANSLDMGTTFTLGVPDHTTATPGEFYSGEAWKGDLTFAVLDVSHVLDKGGVASGDNLSIVSVASVSADTGEGTNLVAYEGGSQGEWSIHWGEGDDDQYVLYAEWKNTDPDEPDEPDEPGTDEPDEPGTDEPDEPGTDEPDDPGTGDADDPGTDEPDEPGTDEPDEPGTGDTDEPGTGDTDDPGTGDADEPGDGGSTPAVDPGRVGVAVENSLWSTKGNAEQLQRAALAQVTAFRFMDHRATRLWGSVLGEYDRVNGSAGADGYEYSGEGYAVGMDRVWKNRYLLGAGFGQMFGKNRGRSLPDVIKQDSVMATVYGAAVQKLSDRDSLTYEGSLTLGWTDNEMSSWQSAVSPAHGDWDSKALLLKGDVIWSRRLSERSVLGLTAGLEFGRAWREGFTETGIGERRFDRSSLTVLSMPIGCSWTHESGIGGKPWVNTLYVAYVPDLYREDPKSAARDGQQAWEVRGVAPGRHALRVGYGTQWAVSESCTLYAGYSFEYRETAAYHNVNAGVSVAF